MTTIETTAHLIRVRRRFQTPGALKAIRGLTGLTQAEAAALVGVSVTTICTWEKGRRAPAVTRQAAYVAALVGLIQREVPENVESLRQLVPPDTGP